MEVLIQNPLKLPVNTHRMKSLTRRLLRAENCAEDVELSVLIADDARIAALNKQYRNVDAPTDVLAFSQTEGEEQGGVRDGLLGDVVISVETARRQAEEQGHSVEKEMDVLLAHGLLHLLGYDHAEPEEERVMIAKQDRAVEEQE